MPSHFIRNSGTLLTGNVVAQGLAFLAYLLLLRLFTPDDFGLCNVFFSYTEVLIILSTCKYEMAIVVAPDDNEASLLARLAFRLNALLTLLLFAVAAVMALTGVTLSNLPAILLLLLPLLVYFTGTYRIYVFLCNRHKEYRALALGEVVSVSGGTVTRILFGLLAPVLNLFHTIGLPLGSVLGKMAGHAYLHHVVCRKNHYYHPTAAPLRPIARKYINFARYVMPRELVSSFSANLPLMWLSLYFDKPLLGLFSLALTFTQRPAGILANTFEKVLYQSSSVTVQQQLPLRRNILRFALLLGVGVAAVAAVVFLFAEPLFVLLFGGQWVGTGYYVRCLLPWMSILVISNSLSFISSIFGTQRVDFILQVVQLLLRAVALYIGIRQGDFQLAVLLFCIVSAVVQAVQLGWYLYQVHRYEQHHTSPCHPPRES
ncbi:MAG: oligosaccharide flippase family protein [Bacteroidales bacterium]|nr:oligosaccharide flippase family protein [Bacteroidales bacterium]